MTGYGHRIFAFDSDGALKRVPNWLARELEEGINAVPRCAGARLRAVSVSLELENKRPVRIREVYGKIWHFDGRGRLADPDALALAMMAEAAKALEGARSGPAEPETVVRLPSPAERARSKLLWEPTPKDINRIVNSIWPGSAPGPVETVETLKGKRGRKPAMTIESHQAKHKCIDSVITITFEIDRLKLKGLQAFIGEALEIAEQDPSDRGGNAIWTGIATAAQHQLDVMNARRSVKGTWYAVAHLSRWEDDDKSIGRGELLEYVECDGRQAAEEAARDLMRKHADRFGWMCGVEIELWPEVEWQPPG